MIVSVARIGNNRYFCKKKDMSNAFYKVPVAVNEPVKSYAPDSPEKKTLINKYKEMYNQSAIDIPMYIGGEEIRTDDKRPMTPPHDHLQS